MTDSVYTVAVVADTHVPDRVGKLHPSLMPALRELRPNQILHAGDICSPGVLDELREIAPVVAVRGNRDWLFVGTLPQVQRMEIQGIEVVLQHGHGNLLDYTIDKLDYLKRGYQVERYTRIVRRMAGDARVLVFGHTHHPEIIWEKDVLLFNPGSASLGPSRKRFPSFGVLNFHDDHSVDGTIQALGKFKWDGERWADFG